ncbi:MAG: NAD(+) synthase [Gemmatimonadetes bacterium]|nr:NAD(+) synthase [Gemmatimonadota bacterium]
MSSSRQRPALRVGLVQMKPAKGDLEPNLAAVRARIAQAGRDHDLLVFPEACLSGYFLEGGVAEVALDAAEVAASLGTPPAGASDVVLGFYERWRGRIYASAAYLTPSDSVWQVVHVHRKMFLPTYGVFDEARFVDHGTELHAFDTRFGRIGMLVCEELWHSLPATVLALAGAELLVVVSASPARDFAPRAAGRPRNLDRWEGIAAATATEHGLFVAIAQLVGSEGGKLFPGGSIVVGPDGSVLARGPLYDEAVVAAVLDGSERDRAHLNGPLLSDLEQMLPHLLRALEDARSLARGLPPGSTEEAEDEEAEPAPRAPRIPLQGGRPDGPIRQDPYDLSGLDLDLELVERTLIEFIREEVRRRRRFERVVVGVSGGVDSAVSLFLAARALGPENVTGFRLPYATSSRDSLDHAELALAAAGVASRTIEITGPIDAYVSAHEPDLSPTRKGNLMSRLRAVILFDQSARLHALPLGTGNKSERLLGYFTWHGDDSPPINPLGDLFKTQVWALARHLGIPDPIVSKPPTADLVKGVTDESEMGIGYSRADPILNGLLLGFHADDLVRRGFVREEVDLVWRRLSTTHWKRELPTVAILSSSAIGEFYLRPVDY